jgi:hypothetical protein
MPRKSEKIPISNPSLDRRVKLSDEQREDIRSEYASGDISQRALADKYGVSRRLISFTLNPEKQEINKQQFKERRKDGRYYNKEKHKEQIKRHRDYKETLYKNNLIKDIKSVDKRNEK